jgi:hypothetical protein
MAFFQSLPFDIKVVLAAFVAVALLAFFSHSQKVEKYCVIVLVLLTAGGVYRYNSTKPMENAIAAQVRPAVTPAPPHRPLETAR